MDIAYIFLPIGILIISLVMSTILNTGTFLYHTHKIFRSLKEMPEVSISNLNNREEELISKELKAIKDYSIRRLYRNNFIFGCLHYVSLILHCISVIFLIIPLYVIIFWSILEGLRELTRFELPVALSVGVAVYQLIAGYFLIHTGVVATAIAGGAGLLAGFLSLKMCRSYQVYKEKHSKKIFVYTASTYQLLQSFGKLLDSK